MEPDVYNEVETGFADDILNIQLVLCNFGFIVE